MVTENDNVDDEGDKVNNLDHRNDGMDDTNRSRDVKKESKADDTPGNFGSTDND